jgi:Ca2+-binding EF-hand superfamily protein
MISGISGNSMMYLQQAQSMQKDLFIAVDSDGSGGLSQSELDTWSKNMSSETGQTVDTSKAISSFDKDGDGALSSTEFASFLQSTGLKGPDGPPPPPQSQDSDSTDSSSSSSQSADSIISSYDTNGDGVLSSSELQAYLDKSTQDSSSNSLSYIEQALSAYIANMGQSTDSSQLGSDLTYINNLNINCDVSA